MAGGSAAGARSANTEGSSKPARRGIQVIARAANILRTLEAENQGLSLSQIAERVGLARPTVQHIVAELQQQDLVMPAGPHSGFQLGPGLVRLGAAAQPGFVEIVRPLLETLFLRIDETIDLSILRGTRVYFIDQIIAQHRLRAVSAIGAAFPLISTANGKAMLAAMENETAEKIFRDTDPAEIGPGKTWDDLLRELTEIRRAGVAYDREEHSEGICALGVDIGRPNGIPAAISIPVPAHRFRRRADELSREILNARERILDALGS